MKRLLSSFLLLFALLFMAPSLASAKGQDFNAVVKIIEQFYRVKHQSLPFLARAGIKTATTAARIAGGTKRRLAEAGSVKLAFFEDQDFGSPREPGNFKSLLNNTLAPSWSPFVQVTATQEAEQVYIFLRDAGEKFHVMVITIEKREAVVVQVTLAPEVLAKLLQDPQGMGKAITDDATTNDQE
jgi:hypothetical protein